MYKADNTGNQTCMKSVVVRVEAEFSLRLNCQTQQKGFHSKLTIQGSCEGIFFEASELTFYSKPDFFRLMAKRSWV